MSIETLLLLAVFVLLPIIEQIVRAVRQRDQRGPQRAEGPPSPPRPPAPVWQPSVVLDRSAVPEPLTLPATPRRTAPAPPALRRGRARDSAATLRDPAGLRRAFVLMTILGPCRAMDGGHSPARQDRPAKR